MKKLIAALAFAAIFSGLPATDTAEAVLNMPPIFGGITFVCYDNYCVCFDSRDCFNMGRSGVCSGPLICIEDICMCSY